MNCMGLTMAVLGTLWIFAAHDCGMDPPFTSAALQPLTASQPRIQPLQLLNQTRSASTTREASGFQSGFEPATAGSIGVHVGNGAMGSLSARASQAQRKATELHDAVDLLSRKLSEQANAASVEMAMVCFAWREQQPLPNQLEWNQVLTIRREETLSQVVDAYRALPLDPIQAVGSELRDLAQSIQQAKDAMDSALRAAQREQQYQQALAQASRVMEQGGHQEVQERIEAKLSELRRSSHELDELSERTGSLGPSLTVTQTRYFDEYERAREIYRNYALLRNSLAGGQNPEPILLWLQAAASGWGRDILSEDSLLALSGFAAASAAWQRSQHPTSPEPRGQPADDSCCFISMIAPPGAYRAEIHRLRQFRDTVLRTTPGGPYFVALYYEHGSNAGQWLQARGMQRYALLGVLAFAFLLDPLPIPTVLCIVWLASAGAGFLVLRHVRRSRRSPKPMT